MTCLMGNLGGPLQQEKKSSVWIKEYSRTGLGGGTRGAVRRGEATPKRPQPIDERAM